MQQLTLGLLAIGAGLVVGVALFVPFVAIAYRRRGRLSPGRILLWVAAVIYFWAIWAYTLLPLPETADISCVSPSLNVFAFVDDLSGALSRGHLLTDPAFLQLALNVVLFVPLGFFLRVLGGRGILVALAVGLAVSALIETTQVTGVWGIYPCAYRMFDVDDLLTNTLGAVIGSLIALIVPARHRGFVKVADPGAPRPVTKWRRFLAMLSDYLGAFFVAATLAIGTQLLLIVVGADELVQAGILASLVGTAGAALLWLVVTLASGQTIGDLAVRLEYRGGPLPEMLARFVRWLAGVGGYILLGAVPWGLSGIVTSVYLLAALIALFTTRAGRGLPGLASRRELVDDRTPVEE